MKYLVNASIFLMLLVLSSFSQGHCEMLLRNYSGATLYTKIYPVSMVFNWPDENSVRKPGYNIIARVKRNIFPLRYDYISGAYYDLNEQTVKTTHKTLHGGYICGQFDADRGGDLSGTHFVYGSGKYRMDFWLGDTLQGGITRPPDDYCIVDIDAYHFSPWIDLNISFYGIGNILYDLGSNCGPTQLSVNRIIKIWDPCPSFNRPKDYGTFKYDKGITTGLFPTPNPYTVFPIDPRQYSTSDYLPSAPTQNHYFNLSNDIGILTLDLTIEKNDANGNPVEITTPTLAPYLNYPPPIIITNGAHLNLEKGANNQERRLRFKKYNSGNYGTPFTISPDGILDLKNSSTSGERSHIIFEDYCNSEVWQYGMLLLRGNSLLTLQGNAFMKLKPNSRLTQHAGSSIHIRNNATLLNCGAKFFVFAPIIQLFDNGRYIISNKCPEDVIPEYETISDSGGALTMSDNSTLEIEAGCKLTFDGPESYLEVNPGTTIKLGNGASIEFKNGAYLDADGCTFTSLESGDVWSGIKLNGAGSNSIIQNCTFNDASTSIEVSNTACIIKENTINLPISITGAVGISGINETNILLQGNTVNMGSNGTATGILLINYSPDDDGGDGLPGGVSAYSLNILNNSFNGGAYPVSITCLAAEQLPYLIKSNIITPLSGTPNYGIFVNKISGHIKNNEFTTLESQNSLTMQQSNVNLFDNEFRSAYNTVILQSASFSQMAPVTTTEGSLAWYGGYNKLTSDYSNDLNFSLNSLPVLSPMGYNCFTLNTTPNYNIIGEFCAGAKPFQAYDNYWIPSTPVFNIFCGFNSVNVNYQPVLTECPVISSDEFVDLDITSHGNGVFDTIFVTAGRGGEGGSKSSFINPNSLYFEALQKRKSGDFGGAIVVCKEIIDNHDSSRYFMNALSELYLNYLESDTTGNQTITTGLFSNLKTYLEQKMNQYENNPVFVETAYRNLLMCIVKTGSYSEAIAGYENIMNNHPDPVTRLNASWDRSAVVLLAGQGGGMGNKITKKSSVKRLLDKNPAHKIAKNIFKDAKTNLDENNDKNPAVKYSTQEKAELNSRIEIFNPVSKTDLTDKLTSDIKLVSVLNVMKNSMNRNGINIPKSFVLKQNYPNPFNPVTLIKFEVPADAMVTIKVYDILGKEVFSVREFRKPGLHENKFDGSNLASGMYFYTLSSGTFSDTKKMVLLK